MQANPAPVQVTVYRWAGQWGPFNVSIPCGECSLTGDVITDTFDNELAGIPVALDTLDWLQMEVVANPGRCSLSPGRPAPARPT